jgi:tetratricopeptide (TPR) repeat protein
MKIQKPLKTNCAALNGRKAWLCGTTRAHATATHMTKNALNRVPYWRLPIACLILASIPTSGCRKVTAAEHLEKGKQFVQRKDYQRGVLELQAAIQSDPKKPEPYYRLAQAYLAMGQLTNGVTYARKATEVDPKYGPAQLQFAELMTRYSTDPKILKDAEQRAAAVLAASPQDSDAKNALAAAELGLGEREKAVQMLEETLRSAPGDLKTAINLAKAKMADKDSDGAVETLKQAVAQSPKSADPALALGQLYMQTKRPAEAEQEFRRALGIDPKRALALALIGQMQVDQGKPDLAEATFQQLSALPDKRYKPTHAAFQFQQGRKEEAIREFEQLAKSDPEDRDARARLVSAYVATGRAADANRVLTEALGKNPKDVGALTQKARLLLTMGKPLEAEIVLQQVLHYSPGSAGTHYLLAQTYKASGAWERQRQELGEAVRLDKNGLQARLELARALLAIPSPNDSLRLLDEAPAQQKLLPSWQVERNWAVLLTGNISQARKDIDEGLALARNRDFLFQDASLKLQQRQMAAARVSLEEILKTRPDDTEALQSLAVSYAIEKHSPAAVERLRRAAASQPKSVAVNLLLASWLERSGDLAACRAALQAARAADPGSSKVALALGELDLREKKLDSARQTLAPLLNSTDNALATEAHLLAGGVEEAAGNYGEAIGHYRQVLARNSAHTVAMQHLAYLLADQANQPDEAMQWAQKAEELAPADPQSRDTIGWTLYHKGMYSAALKQLEFASAPASRPRQKLHLALVYFKLGDLDQGKRILAAALQQNPDLPKSLSPYETLALGSR